MNLLGMALAALAATWTAVSIDVVIESSVASTSDIRLLGRSVLTTTDTLQTMVLLILAFGVGALLEGTIGYRVRRRADRSIMAALEEHRQEIALTEASVAARSRFLDWRIGDLQRQVDDLESRRDLLIQQEHRDLDAARELVLTSKTRKKLRERREGSLIALPDLAPDAADPT